MWCNHGVVENDRRSDPGRINGAIAVAADETYVDLTSVDLSIDGRSQRLVGLAEDGSKAMLILRQPTLIDHLKFTDSPG